MFDDNIFIFIIILVAIAIVAYLVVSRSDDSIIKKTEVDSDSWEEFQSKPKNNIPAPPPQGPPNFQGSPLQGASYQGASPQGPPHQVLQGPQAPPKQQIEQRAQHLYEDDEDNIQYNES